MITQKLSHLVPYISSIQTNDGLDETQPDRYDVPSIPGALGVCPSCGEIWYRITNFSLTPQTGTPIRHVYSVRSVICKNHPPYTGSILEAECLSPSPYSYPLALGTNFIPGPAFILREYNIALNQGTN